MRSKKNIGVLIMVITLCGSARFRKEIESMLDVTHRKKIDLSDAIYVINVNGYIGQSTSNEIEYAKNKGKEVIYLKDKLYI